MLQDHLDREVLALCSNFLDSSRVSTVEHGDAVFVSEKIFAEDEEEEEEEEGRRRQEYKKVVGRSKMERCRFSCC